MKIVIIFLIVLMLMACVTPPKYNYNPETVVIQESNSNIALLIVCGILIGYMGAETVNDFIYEEVE